MAQPVLPYTTEDSGVDFEEVIHNQKAAPFSYEDFKRFLEKEHANENLEFYEKVEQFKTGGSEDGESVKSSDDIAKEVTEQYIKETGEKQINIDYELRSRIVEEVEKTPQVEKTVFDDAQNEVRELMKSGAFMRFVKNALSKNITQEHGDWRKKVGVYFTLSGIALVILVFVLQIALPETILDSRYWRVIGLPFFVGGYSYYQSGSKCLCSGLAARGVYMRPGENRTWKDIFYQKNKDENKIIDTYAARKLAWEGRKLTYQSIAFGLLVTAILVVLPPGDDIYGDVF